MSITAWDNNATNNGTRLASGNFSEGQAPSTLNDGARQVMASIRSWANDLEWYEYGTGANTTSYTRVSATSISIPLDVTSQFQINRRVKIVDGTGATVYGRVSSASYSSPNTTVGFEFDSGSLGSGNPTSVKYGIIAPNNTSVPSLTPVASIVTYGGSTAPSGWLICDGSTKSKTDYSQLFAVLGNTFGTATATNFYLPDLQAKFPLGKSGSYALGTTGGAFAQTPTGSVSSSFTGNPFTPLGNVSISGTVAGHQLSVSEMPSHNHSMTLYLGGYGTVDTSTGNGYRIAGGDSNVSIPGYGGTNYSGNNTGSNSTHNHGFSGSGTFNGTSSNPTGSVASTLTGSALDTTNPYVALNYIIKY
jgi:microcystin-dependent protein